MKIEEAVAILRDGAFPDDMSGTERAYKVDEAAYALADAYLALHREDDGRNCAGCQTLEAIRKAILKYYAALDRRKHGGDAADEAFKEIRDAMGMQWEPGATLKKQSTETQPRR